MGVVPQKAALFKGTIRDNLQWGKPTLPTRKSCGRRWKRHRPRKFVERKARGLGCSCGPGGQELLRRPATASDDRQGPGAKPEILILDDSATALDFATDARLRKAIREMEDRTTVFIVIPAGLHHPLCGQDPCPGRRRGRRHWHPRGTAKGPATCIRRSSLPSTRPKERRCTAWHAER